MPLCHGNYDQDKTRNADHSHVADSVRNPVLTAHRQMSNIASNSQQLPAPPSPSTCDPHLGLPKPPLIHLLPINPLPPLSAFSQPPLSLIPPSQLLSLRDHYYSSHPLPLPSPPFISETTRLLNLHPNSTPPLSLLLPLSLLSPRSVLVAICQWAIRQTLPQRIHLASQTLLGLGHLVLYPLLPSRQTILAHWFWSQLKLPLEHDDPLESRLSHFLALLMQCRNSSGVRLFRVRDWLQGVVNPLVRERCWDGLFVAIRAVDVVDGEFPVEARGLGEVVRALGVVVSAEKRCKGEMELVKKGMECLRVLGRKFRGEGRGSGWLVEWLMEGHVGEFVNAMVQGDGVEGCEVIMIMYAVGRDVDDIVRAVRGGRGWEDPVWMTALVRQMGLMTVEEIERLFSEGVLGGLVSGVDGGTAELAEIGLRALTVLLVNPYVRGSVAGDEGAPMRVLRGMCKAFLRVEGRVEVVRLLRHLYKMADRSCRPGVEYFDDHGAVMGGILVEVLLEMARRFGGGVHVDSSCNEVVDQVEKERLIDMMRSPSDSPVCRTIAEHIIRAYLGKQENYI